MLGRMHHDTRTSSHRYLNRTITPVALAVIATVAGCRDSDPAADTGAATPDDSSTPVPATAASTTGPVTTPPATTAPEIDLPTTTHTTESAAPPTTVHESWRDDAIAWCEQATAEYVAIAPPSSTDDVARYVEDFIALRDSIRPATPEWPTELTQKPYDLDDLQRQSDLWIDRAAEQVSAGQIDGAEFSDTASGSVDYYRYLLSQSSAVLAIAGIPCGFADPARIAGADLNVPIFHASQVETGFDSVWVSSGANRAVHRIDPDSGNELAVIDVGSAPFKLQPANGRMIVRTVDAYVAIDPASNTVVETLAKADVGPAADRSWAVDGAMWICDGQQVHRYDPTTFEPVITIELGFDCGQVYADEHFVIPWSYNQDDGESGTSVAAFVDPTTNQIQATVDLPVDVGVPIVLDNEVFFPPYGTGQGVVIDRANWSATSIDDFSGDIRGSQSAFDGTSIYVIADGAVAVVNPNTFAVTETIEAFNFDAPARIGLNSLAVMPGSLWVVNDDAGILQRFDRPT
jgi:hypothetical protein